MQFATTKAALAPQLGLVSGAADTRGVVPALSNVLLKANANGELAMVCSDTGIVARAVSTVQVTEGGEIAVDVTRLSALVRAIPDQQNIEISTDTEKGTLLLKSGRSRFRLPTLPAADFPRVSPVKEERIAITMSARRLTELIGDVASSMADSDARPFMNGTLFSLDSKGLWLVATDGCRMTVSHEPIPGTETMVKRNIIVPRKTVLLAKKLLGQGGNTTVTFGSKSIQFQFEDGSLLYGNAIDGNFPDYMTVMPKTSMTMKASAERCMSALSMLAATPQSKPGSDLTLKHKIELSIDSTTATLRRGDDGMCEIECNANTTQPLEFAINIGFLTDAVGIAKSASDEVQIDFSDSVTMPITVRPAGKHFPLCIVMPMKG